MELPEWYRSPVPRAIMEAETEEPLF